MLICTSVVQVSVRFGRTSLGNPGGTPPGGFFSLPTLVRRRLRVFHRENGRTIQLPLSLSSTAVKSKRRRSQELISTLSLGIVEKFYRFRVTAPKFRTHMPTSASCVAINRTTRGNGSTAGGVVHAYSTRVKVSCRNVDSTSPAPVSCLRTSLCKGPSLVQPQPPSRTLFSPRLVNQNCATLLLCLSLSLFHSHSLSHDATL